MSLPFPWNAKGGISPAVKISVIILTIVTIVAFGAFFIKLFSRMAAPSSGGEHIHRYKVIGDRLKSDGLVEQAVEQYKKFLTYDEIDSKTRSSVSQTVGEIYIEMGNCRDALVWLYHAEAAGPEPNQRELLQSQIDACRIQVKSNSP